MNSNKFLKFLIVIGIIAILISAYLQYLKPYIIELSEQKRDPLRIQELSAIDSALDKLKDVNQDVFLGEPNKVYISIPSHDANCSGLNLPSLPDEWEYRCQSELDFQKIDGQGWMPVDFTQLPDDKDNVIPNLFRDLPIDPANIAENGYYYTYVVGEENDWVLTSLLESDKYFKKTALKDNGTDPARFEIGSNLQLWAKASGIVGYWNFDEGQGQIAKDLSINNNDGTLINGPTWIDGKLGKALSFDGIDDYVEVPDSASLDITGDKITVELWVKMTYEGNQAGAILSKGKFKVFGYNGPNWEPAFQDGYQFAITIGGTEHYSGTYTMNQYEKWHHIVGVYDSANLMLYIDGILRLNSSLAGSIDSSATIPLKIQREPVFKVDIDEVRIYNRVLSATEIQAIYNNVTK